MREAPLDGAVRVDVVEEVLCELRIPNDKKPVSQLVDLLAWPALAADGRGESGGAT